MVVYATKKGRRSGLAGGDVVLLFSGLTFRRREKNPKPSPSHRDLTLSKVPLGLNSVTFFFPTGWLRKASVSFGKKRAVTFPLWENLPITWNCLRPRISGAFVAFSHAADIIRRPTRHHLFKDVVNVHFETLEPERQSFPSRLQPPHLRPPASLCSRRRCDVGETSIRSGGRGDEARLSSTFLEFAGADRIWPDSPRDASAQLYLVHTTDAVM